jgi:hypothetical protein
LIININNGKKNKNTIDNSMAKIVQNLKIEPHYSQEPKDKKALLTQSEISISKEIKTKNIERSTERRGVEAGTRYPNRFR